MAPNGSSRLHSRHVQRLHDTLYKKTDHSTIFKEKYKEIWNQRVSENDARVKEFAKSGSLGEGQMDKGIHFAHVSNSENRWFVKTDLQPKASESISSTQKVQIGKSATSSSFPETERLHGKTGHLSGLLPHTNFRTSSKVFMSSIQGSGLQHNVSPIRTGKRSTGVLASQQLASEPVSSIRYESISILGRFPSCPSGCTDPSGASEFNNKSSSTAGLASKSPEISDHSCKEIKILGNHLGYRNESENLAGNQKGPNFEHYQSDCNGRQVDLDEWNFLAGSTQFCGDGKPTGSSVFTRITKSELKASRMQAQEEDDGPATGSERLCLVETEHPSNRPGIPGTSDHIFDDGCVRERMGFSFEWRSASRTVDSGADAVACKSQRALHRIDSSQGIQSKTPEQIGNAAIRQHDCRSLHKEARRDKVQEAAGFGPPSSDPPNSLLPTGDIQLLGGQAIARFASYGLASEGQPDTADIREVGIPTNRSVCDESIQSCSDICYPGSGRSQSGIHQCVQQDLGSRLSLGISTPSADPGSSTTSELGEGNVFDCGTSMGENVLEKRVEKQKYSGSLRTAKSGALVGRSSDRKAPSGRKRSLFGGLEDTGWTDLVSGLSSADLDLISSAWRSSTWKTYSSAWKQWSSWCQRRFTD